jgi:osmotically-inducible protein OsmY
MSSAKKLNAFQGAVLAAVLTISFAATAGQTSATPFGGSTLDQPGKPETTATAATKSDRELERDIVIALTHDDINNGSVYRNVKIVATNGRVALTGKVKNEKQHTKLIHITSGIVDAAHIQDQIEVK